MLKRLVIALLTVVGWVSPVPCVAQFIGYTSPQTVQQNLVTNGTCTGSLQSFPITNLGQTTHFLSWINSPSAQSFNISISGSYNGTSFATFSDNAHSPTGILQATGYYPALRADVVCTSGSTFTVNYSGTSTFAIQSTGFADRATFEKPWAISAPTNANLANTVNPPYGSTAAIVFFQYTSASEPAGSTLTVTSQTTNLAASVTLLNAVSIAQNNNLQVWIIPNVPSVQLTLTYTSGGSGASTFTSQVEFFRPGEVPYSADPCKYTGVAAQIGNCPTLP